MCVCVYLCIYIYVCVCVCVHYYKSSVALQQQVLFKIHKLLIEKNRQNLLLKPGLRLSLHYILSEQK